VNPDRWRHVRDLFALGQARLGADREAFLDEACAGDPLLRREVENLLRAHEAAGSFLESPAAADALLTPDPGDGPPRARFGPYRVLRELGHGGMGTVYLAEREDGSVRRRVAIKVIRRGLDTDALRRRFLRERQILAGLEHAAIARLYEDGTTEDGLPYFVMEAIDGVDLLAWCDLRRLPTRRRVELFVRVCEAVHYAHQRLVVHRDLKPGNILVTADGGPRLLDFGLARLLDPTSDPEAADLSALGVRFCTPEYASPEQLRGEPIATTSDVYSLGVILYELLTGHRPYRLRNRSLEEAQRVVGEVEPERPSTVVTRTVADGTDGTQGTITPETVSRARDGSPSRLRRSLAGDLDNIVLKAMRKDPSRRYGSVEELLEDLRRHLDGLPVRARPDTPFYRARKLVGRHRVEAGAAALVVLLVAAYAVSVARERDLARHEAEKAQQVASFLGSLFSAADPNQSTGRKLTAEELLRRGGERVTEELAGQPELEATMLHTIGGVETQLGLYEQARPHLERALELRRRLLGEEHADTALSLRALGLLLHLTAKYDEAQPLLERALTIQEALLGRDDVEVARTLTNLGNTLKAKGDYTASRAAFERAIAILEGGRRDPYSPDLARAYNNYGVMLVRIHDWPGAAAAYRKALAIHEHNQGPDGALVAGTLQNLAAALKGLDDGAGALALLERGSRIAARTYGTKHRVYANGLTDLADLQLELGQVDRAETTFHACVDAYAAALGGEHPDGSWCVRGLGRVAEARGDLPAALASYERALAMRQGGFGEWHDSIAVSLHDVARMRWRLGDPAAAEPLLRRAVEIDRKSLPADDHNTGVVLADLGELLLAEGKREEAGSALLAARDILRAGKTPSSRLPEVEREIRGLAAAPSGPKS